MYKVGTGWIGWTPEETWNATLWELEMAHEGRIDMLKLCFGDGSEQSAEQTEGTVPATKRNVLDLFRTLKSKAKGKAK